MVKLMLIICTMSLLVTAQTNVNQNPFEDYKIIDLAYTNYDYFYTDKGYLVIKQPLVIKAKLKIFDFYFSPHPYQNRFQDLLLDFDTLINDYEILQNKNNDLKKRNRKLFFIGVGSGAGLILIPAILVKIFCP